MLGKEISKKSNAKMFEDATLTENNDRKRAGFDCLGEIVARLLGCHENCVMDEAHLTNPTFREMFRAFCNEFLKGVEQEWIFFEANVVACINNIYHDWHMNGREELSRLKSLADQIKVYSVPPDGQFPGHEKPRLVRPQECPKFEDSQKEEALEWLYGKIK